MTPEIEDVKGVGKKVDTLKEAGIDSVQKLAESKVEDLTELKGIGKATAEKMIANAKELLSGSTDEVIEPTMATMAAPSEEEKKLQEEQAKAIEEKIKKLEEKRKRLDGAKVEEGDFILLKMTAKTQHGKIFRVSSEADAKKAGIYNEERAKQGAYTPEYVVVGKPGFVNEGLTETIKEMTYFEKKSVRIPPNKAFGKRDAQKVDRMSIPKFRKQNEGNDPKLGQEVRNKKNQTGYITKIDQGRVTIDYNHPLAGQNIDYNLEIIDKIEEFDEKIQFFMMNKGLPEEYAKEFTLNYNDDDKSLEVIVPKMLHFQNLTMLKFGLAMDLQTHMDIGDVKYVEVFEKIQLPPSPAESVAQKVEEFDKEHDHEHDHD